MTRKKITGFAEGIFELQQTTDVLYADLVYLLEIWDQVNPDNSAPIYLQSKVLLDAIEKEYPDVVLRYNQEQA